MSEHHQGLISLPFSVSVPRIYGFGDNMALSDPQGLKSQSRIKLNIVRCPPVTMVLIRRPDLRYQLGFSVQNGIVSLKLGTFKMSKCDFFC